MKKTWKSYENDERKVYWNKKKEENAIKTVNWLFFF